MHARPQAKVNLTLEVLGRRPDGYHELRSIFLRIGLCDRLTLTPGAGPRDQLVVTGLPGTPVDGNLVLRALDALRAHAGVDFPPLDVTLEKHIPAAAGLGGGSSDCASALRLAQTAWGVRVARRDELPLAESLGSDVPFFYFNMAAASVSGRGENLSWLPAIHGEIGVLLVHPPARLSTPSVYARYDGLDAPPLLRHGVPAKTAEASEENDLESMFWDEITSNDLLTWAQSTDEPNDLWPAAVALEPSLGGLRSDLEKKTRRRWLMTGSGPTLFSLYPSPQEAVEAGRRLVSAESEALGGAIINAVDLTGPEPLWRYP